MRFSARYVALLQHPRWQRRRLEIFELAQWRCERCGEENQQLHVHHLRYKRGRKPWDYPDRDLECLCHACHFAEHHDALIEFDDPVMTIDQQNAARDAADDRLDFLRGGGGQ